MDVQKLIPSHKSDLETASQLKNYPFETIQPIIPELISCIQDLHWPISEPVGQFLQSISNNITDQILFVLRGDDTIWKFNCLVVFFIRNETLSIDRQILKCIPSFIEYDGFDEDLLDLKELSEEILSKLNL